METGRRGTVLEKSVPCHENRQQLGLQEQSHLPVAFLEVGTFPGLGGWAGRKESAPGVAQSLVRNHLSNYIPHR